MTRCANCGRGSAGRWINGRGQALCGHCGPDFGTRAVRARTRPHYPAWLPASEPGLRAIWRKHTAAGAVPTKRRSAA